MTIAKPNDDYTQVIQEMLEIAGKHGVNLIPEGIEMNESGMDFLVGFAEEAGTGARWILRKPRRPDVLDRADNEARVLKLIQSHLSVDVPDWRIYTPELIAYPRLAGDLPLPSAWKDMHGIWIMRIRETGLSAHWLKRWLPCMASIMTRPGGRSAGKESPRGS